MANKVNIYAIPRIPPNTSIAPTGIAVATAAPPVAALAARLVALPMRPPELELELEDEEPDDMEVDEEPDDMEVDEEPDDMDVDEVLDEPELEVPLELPPVMEFRTEPGALVAEERMDPILVMELKRPLEESWACAPRARSEMRGVRSTRRMAAVM